MKNLAGLMKQASQMQTQMQDMQAKLEVMQFEGVAGAGLVRLLLTGRGDVRSITIDPKLADPTDMETMQDLVVAAHADAKRKLDTTTAAEMQKVTGGLDLGGLKLPF